MSKMQKIVAIAINIVFSISCFYFLLFYTMGIINWPLFMNVGIINFLFYEETVIFPVIVCAIASFVVAILMFTVYRKLFSKVTKISIGLGTATAIIPIFCNTYIGSLTEKNDGIGPLIYLLIVVLLLLYLVFL